MLTDWLADKENNSLTPSFLTDKLIDSLSYSLTDLLTDWLTDYKG